MNSTGVEHRSDRTLKAAGDRRAAIAVKEFRELRRDRRTPAVLFLLPFLRLVVFGYAAGVDIKSVRTVIVGRDLRVPGGEVAPVRAALDASGVSAVLSVVPATIEATFFRLALARRDSIGTHLERTTQ